MNESRLPNANGNVTQLKKLNTCKMNGNSQRYWPDVRPKAEKH